MVIPKQTSGSAPPPAAASKEATIASQDFQQLEHPAAPELVPIGALNAVFCSLAALNAQQHIHDSTSSSSSDEPDSSAVEDADADALARAPRTSHFSVPFPALGQCPAAAFSPAALTRVTRVVDPVLRTATLRRPDLAALLAAAAPHDAWAAAHLRWLLQKDALGNDAFLLGTGPQRRWLAVHFAALTGREVEYVALTRDTTEGDLKQRRELVAGGSSVFSDSPVVAAALRGRLLVLEGMERAERNVLPILNNLLENREMQLEDGRFLVAPARYQSILKAHAQQQKSKAAAKAAAAQAQANDSSTAAAQTRLAKLASAAGLSVANSASNTDTDAESSEDAAAAAALAGRLVPTHPRFRVIAIGAPAPPFPGNPLDPPLRSRFQGRRVDLPPPRALTALLYTAYKHALRTLTAETTVCKCAPLPHALLLLPPPSAATAAAAPCRDCARASWVALALVRFVGALSAVTARAATAAGVSASHLAYSHLPLPSLPALLLAAAGAAVFPRLSLPAALHAGYPWTLTVTDAEAVAVVEAEAARLAKTQWQRDNANNINVKSNHSDVKTANGNSAAIVSSSIVCEQYDVVGVSVAPFATPHGLAATFAPPRLALPSVTAPTAAATATVGAANGSVEGWRKLALSGVTAGACPAFQPIVPCAAAEDSATAAASAASASSVAESAGPLALADCDGEDELGRLLAASTDATEGTVLTVTFVPAYLNENSAGSANAILNRANADNSAAESSAHGSVMVSALAGAGLSAAPWPAPFASADRDPQQSALSLAGGRLQRLALASLLRLHALGRDLCLVGTKGEGKSYLAALFARALGFAPVETMFLYKDMSARDLLQRRSTSPAGETVWLDSPLVTALRRGRLVVLDGVHRLSPGTLAALGRLLEDREVALFDRTRFVRWDRFHALRRRLDVSAAELNARGVFAIAPSFRVLALAAPPSRTAPWLTHDVTGYFAFVPYALLAGTTATAPPSEEALELALIAAQTQAAEKERNAALGLASAGKDAEADPVAAALAARYAGAAWLWGAAPPRVAALLRSIVPHCPPATLLRLEAFAVRVHELAADPLVKLQDPVSLRQLVRAAKRAAAFPGRLFDTLARVCMFRFTPAAKRELLVATLAGLGVTPDSDESEVASADAASSGNSVMDSVSPDAVVRAELKPSASGAKTSTAPLKIVLTADTVSIGDVSARRHWPTQPELVPEVVFFDIPRHVAVLRDMLQDFSVLREPLLLIGVQGVGKNKLSDRLLQLLRREREYTQLHRDSTVQSLTLAPALDRGVVVWADSPLVRALRQGSVLMVDEVDKAPTEVVCVLKSLLEDGEILLGDGRRFVTERSPLWATAEDAAAAPTAAAAPAGSRDSSSPAGDAAAGRVYRVHRGFQVIALANPPGYPFLGNDFYAEMGDCFACHVVDNPDPASEAALLKAYAPSLPQDTLDRLVRAFAALRALNEQGTVSYPYSTRELVQTARHLHANPLDPLPTVLQVRL